MAERVRVFVSSRYALFEREREFVKMVCDEMGLEGRTYPESAISGSPPRKWLEELRNCHLVIYLISPTEESDEVNDELKLAGEWGIPILPFALKNTVDVAAFRQEYATEVVAAFDDLTELREVVRTAISRVLLSHFSSSFKLEPWNPRVYSDSATLVEQVHLRLGYVQESSSLFLGPKKGRATEESQFLRAVDRLIERTRTGRTQARVLHLFDKDKTAEAAADTRSYPDAERHMARLSELLEQTPGLEVVGVSGPVTSAIVADYSLGIAARYDQAYFVWVREHRAGANTLWSILESLSREGEPARTFLDSRFNG